MKQKTILLPAAMRRYCIPTLLVALLWATGSGAAQAQNINSGNITITADGTYTITGSTTTNRIKVNSGVTAHITLQDVNITLSPAGNINNAFDITSGATVYLTLSGNNTLRSGNTKAALHVPEGATLIITAGSAGSLTAASPHQGAGIGSDKCNDCNFGSITISGGTVTATGGYSGGAGIGSGYGDRNTGNIKITGGTVTATGGSGGAGIGGGSGSNGTILISGGTVTATGSGSAAGIGAGYFFKVDGAVTITGGTVTATGGNGAAGIGGGSEGWNTETVTINGGTVKATGGNGGIGKGNTHNGGASVTITGGSIAASINVTPNNGAGKNVHLNTLTVGSPAVANAAITAGSIAGVACNDIPDAAAGVYGIKDVTTDAAGKVYFYLPATTPAKRIKLTANSTIYGKSYTRVAGNNAQTLLLHVLSLNISEDVPKIFTAEPYGYSPLSPFSVTVSNTGSAPTGDLSVTLSGTNASAFTLSSSSIASIAAGSTGTFTVVPNTGLTAGTYTATVTVTPTAPDISDVSFDVSFTVDKKAITITGGTVTAKTYDGAAAATVTGLTFDGLVSPDDNSNFALDTDYEVTAAFDNANAGTGKTVTVNATLKNTPKANNYTLTNGTGYSGTGTIDKATPTAAHLNITLPASSVPYDGLPHAATAALNGAYTGMGAITVKYNGVATAPSAPGTYAVTVDIVEGANFTAANLSSGTFSIGGMSLTKDHLKYDLAAVPYTGKPQGIAPPTLKSPLAGGDITVKYGGSTTAPVNVGTYAVTVDVENVTDYVDTLGMPLGDFVIRKAVPTTAYLDYVLSDFIYDGESHGITVKPKEGVVGLGAITVLYDGNESPPEAEGEYAVTVDIAESDNYEAVTLELGHIAIYRQPRPSLIRKVTVEPSEYYDISPSPGVHDVVSGRDMTLTLTPLAALPSGYVPQVTTDRRLVPDSEQSIEIQSDADGTYTVRIRSVQEATVVTVTAVAFQSADRVAPAQVWSYGRQLYVAASVSGRAYIYNVSGRVVKIVPTVAGETVAQALSPGIYFVSTGGKSFKVVITE